MAKGYLGDLLDTYLDGTVLGAAGGAISVALEGVDQGIRAISGRAYEAPSGIAGRTIRDVRAAMNHLLNGELLKAGSATWSIISGDVVMDIWDLCSGKHR